MAFAFPRAHTSSEPRIRTRLVGLGAPPPVQDHATASTTDFRGGVASRQVAPPRWVRPTRRPVTKWWMARKAITSYANKPGRAPLRRRGRCRRRATSPRREVPRSRGPRSGAPRSSGAAAASSGSGRWRKYSSWPRQRGPDQRRRPSAVSKSWMRSLRSSRASVPARERLKELRAVRDRQPPAPGTPLVARATRVELANYALQGGRPIGIERNAG